MPEQLIIRDLGLMPYRTAWAEQEKAHERVLNGAVEEILLVEHPPVITLGRRPDVSRNLIVSEDQLSRLGVELVQSDRGGDITFHGPGQIVAYPIVRLADQKLSVSGYVHRLEEIVIATLAEIGIKANTDPQAIGIWVAGAKIGAIGVRIRRGVTLHGLALNVSTDLKFFELIVPCGLSKPVTNVGRVLGDRAPKVGDVKAILRQQLVRAFKPSPCTQGEGLGEGAFSNSDAKDPHPSPLPDYRERG